MDKSFPAAMLPVTDVYTNIQGMQALKGEKNDAVALKKIAQQFESMFISLLMKNVRAADSVFEEGSLFKSEEGDFYRDMYDNQLSLTLAHGRGFGIADQLYRQLSQRYGRTDTGLSGENTLQPLNEKNARQALTLPRNESLQSDRVQPLQSDSEKTRAPFVMETSAASSDVDSSSPAAFVKSLFQHAQSAAKHLGVDAETLISQAALETGWGKHVFKTAANASSNNFFNIKAAASWVGSKFNKQTLEFVQGAMVPVQAQFRSYASAAESFQDYVDFIRGSERYRPSLEGTGNGMDYIREIHKAGYASDPDYATKIEAVYQQVKSITATWSDQGDV